MWDAIVAGAGPAGAVAAFVLAREGHRTLLADRPNADSCKIGDALPGAAERLLQSLGLPALQGDEAHARIGGNLSSWNSDALVATDFITGLAGEQGEQLHQRLGLRPLGRTRPIEAKTQRRQTVLTPCVKLKDWWVRTDSNRGPAD